LLGITPVAFRAQGGFAKARQSCKHFSRARLPSHPPLEQLMIQTRPRLRMASLVALAALIAGSVAFLLLRGSRMAPGDLGDSPTLPFKIAWGKLPLAFEANRGQAPSEVSFLARTRGANVFLTRRGLTVGLRGKYDLPLAVQMKLEAASLAEPSGIEELSGKANYFIGSDAKTWQTGVSLFRRVKYADVYPGVDLVYYGNHRQLEYDFILRPGANPDDIQWRIEGADSVELGANGDLIVRVAGAQLVQRRPRVYQRRGDETRELQGAYALATGNRVQFRVGGYDRSQPLVIDPVLSFSTYAGGSAEDYARGIAVDSSGIYVVGSTISPNFPVANARQPTLAGNFDAFLLKLNSTGSALIYATYLGGSGNDFGSAVAVDGAGNAYVTGWTLSTNFPTANPRQATPASAQDAFVAKVSPNGSTLGYSTYLGGNNDDFGRAIAVDPAGNAYIAGSTSSTNFPTASPWQGAVRGYFDAFVTKMNPSGSTLVYSTYLGGTLTDEANGIAIDSVGAAYVVGYTQSRDFPTLAAFQGTSGGATDAFVSKLNASGSLAYSTYLGGSSTDFGYGIAVDSSFRAVVVGQTYSTDFPIAPLAPAPDAGFQQMLSGDGTISADGFVTKLSPGGSALVYSTYLGGTGSENAFSVALDSAGNAFVTGETSSANFPALGSLQPPAGDLDVFVAELNPAGAALVYSTYVGGAAEDSARSIALDSAGNAYVAGHTRSTDFPTSPGVFQSTPGGGLDALVAAVSPSTAVTLSRIDPSTGPTAGGTSVTIRGANFMVGATVTIGGQAANNVAVTSAGTITAKTPAHATGMVDVVVTNPGGQSSTLSASFNYADAPIGGGGSGGKGCGGAGAPVGVLLGLAALLRRLRKAMRSRRVLGFRLPQ